MLQVLPGSGWDAKHLGLGTNNGSYVLTVSPTLIIYPHQGRELSLIPIEI